MSQMQRFFVDIESLTGNSGGPVDPTNGNISIVGATPINVVGDPLTSTLTISAAASVATQYDADTGSAIPVGHILNIIGSHNINTVGAANNISIRGDNAITLGNLAPVVGNSLTLTTGNETITAGDLTLSSGDIHVTGNIAVSGLTAHGILIGHGASNVTSSVLTDGELLIGKTGFDPVATGLTAGPGITIAPGAGSITISSFGGLSWINQAVSLNPIVAGIGYIAIKNGLLDLTLPALPTLGDVFRVTTGILLANAWQVSLNTGTLYVCNQTSIVGCASTTIGDSIEIVCIVGGVNPAYRVVSNIGNLVIL